MKEQLKPLELPIKEVDLSRFDIRLEKETLRDEEFSTLVDSIKEIGIRVPIHIVEFKGSLEVIDGGRRLKAAKVAGLKTIPTIQIQDVKTELEIRRDALVNNEIRKDLTIDERGEALLKYYKCGGFEADQTEELISKIYAASFNRTTFSGKSNFLSLVNNLKIPIGTQYTSIKYVNRVEKDVREEAAKDKIPVRDRKTLYSEKITTSKDKEAVKKAQRNIMATMKQTRGQTQSYKKARVDQAVEYERDELESKSQKPKRIMSAEESAEVAEAERKDKMTPYKLMGVLNGGLTKVWEGLTQQKYIPIVNGVTELRKDHIAPTRQFRKDLADMIPKNERILLDNWITFVRIAMDDMEEVLGKADTTAFDTRK